ncbi:hypothetical protein EW146_g2264 [Bondarzewia mesenterica]|uniref:NadR/Ttd14 AAA domain-containing protein n=1 Tax=Bondarzewia mesenterica TaxID=1095465 RepID=A0A4S4M137_9AGAM|nr:hypothetical protein EW146_g2264 [Bondarzewia mesenterica]
MMSTAAAQRVSAIYIVGPSSTGKTTLCNALAARLGLSSTVCITEVARTVMRQQGFTRDDVARPEMQKAIMDAQLEHDKGARGAAAGDHGRARHCTGRQVGGGSYCVRGAQQLRPADFYYLAGLSSRLARLSAFNFRSSPPNS